MAVMVEKKVYFLGAWQENRVDNGVIAQINNEIYNEKGRKVKLQMFTDGLRLVKNTMIQGKMLQDFIPMDKIQFMTVSQKMPDILIVIALSRDPDRKFQIHAFRCGNGMDAGIFLGTFRNLNRKGRPVAVIKEQGPPATENEINWTLRNKQQDNSKRELKKLVDLHGEKAIVHKTEEPQVVVANGHTEVFEGGVRIPLYRKGRPTRLESSQSSVIDDRDGLDSRSEVSESALRQELESLSQELRDIKIMLEQSTGITAGSEPNSPRDFKPVNVEVHNHTVKQPETVVVTRRVERDEPTVETVVLGDEDEVEMRPKKSGYYVMSNGNTTHVRVSVPDYRSSNSNISQADSEVSYTVKKSEPSFEVSRASTTSYESWKQDTLQRNAVVYRDIPERIQWKSRGARQSHVVSARSRPAINTDKVQMVQVRHHSAGLGPSYQRLSYNPQMVRVNDRRSHSMKVRGISTTVARPIERVYSGHPEAKHHSMVMRAPGSNTRPSILVKDGSVRGSQILVAEENNNIVKHELNDTEPLDVSGIDLYRETPSEVILTDGQIIRT